MSKMRHLPRLVWNEATATEQWVELFGENVVRGFMSAKWKERLETISGVEGKKS